MSVPTTVYVDQLFYAESRESQAFRVGSRHGHQWSHMWSENIESLHKMADRIGMRRSWFQNKPGFPHYDLVPSRRSLALKYGAIERPLMDYLRENMPKPSLQSPRLKRPTAQRKVTSRRQKRSSAGSGATNGTDHAKLTVKTLKLADLHPHPKNPRVHPEPGSYEWESLKASLANIYFDPLVWNSRSKLLVSGHLRKKILQEMGVMKADCVVLDIDEPTHLSLLMRANNASGEFDNGAVTKLLKELEKQDFDINLTGFGEKQIVQFLAANKKAMDDAIPDRFEIVVECKSKREQQRLYERFIGEQLTVRLQTF